jgi:hypothetical protein
MNSSLEQLKESKKLEILLNQSKVGLLGGFLITSLVMFLFCYRTDQNYLSIWFTFYLVVSGLRYFYTSTVSL